MTSDAVFGVRKSLVVVSVIHIVTSDFELMHPKKPEIISDVSITKARGFREDISHAYLKQDFVLATPEEGAEARKAKMPAL